MTSQIRPFERDDYEAIADVWARAMPEYPETAEEIRHRDDRRDLQCRFRRFVATLAGQVIGYAQYDQSPAMYHPQKFSVAVCVNPDHQRQGIGTALYDYLTMDLAAYDPITLRTFAREDDESSLSFVHQRGFGEVMRSWESRLDLASFDPSPYGDLPERIRDRGLEIRSFAHLASDPNRDRKLYELDLDLLKDVPFPDVQTEMSFEHFKRRFLENPNLLPEAYVVATDGDHYVGASSLWKSQASPDELYTGLTGVRRDCRRQGVALALKLHTIRYAQDHGYATIRTENASTNRPMLAINEQLGYVKQPAWITFAKQLQTASRDAA